MTATGFAALAPIWRAAGWEGTLPVATGTKKLDLRGYTGKTGRDPTTDEVAQWARTRGSDNLAIRVGPDVIGIDVDAYKPEGAHSWAELIKKYGPAPPTWIVTSRTDEISGIRLYRIPPGVRLKGNPRPGIEIIQHHHRYFMAPGSIHPEGRIYQLLDPWWNAGPASTSPGALAFLSTDWIEALREPVKEAGAPPERRHAADWSPSVTKAFADAAAGMTKGSRHDTATKAALGLARYERLDYPGATDALDALGRTFTTAIADRTTNGQADKEWADIVDSARTIAASSPSSAPQWEDRTHDVFSGHREEPVPAPGDDDRTDDRTDDRDEARPAEGATAPRIARDGATFILDEPAELDPRWGSDGEVAWAKGEPLIIVGPPGVGKTTIAGQLISGLIGIVDEVLGLPVAPARRVLLLAMDRPRQVRRALRRRFGEEHRQALTDHLIVRPGPLSADLGKNPALLVELARHYDADVVIIDSLKDAAVKLSEDEVGGNVNRAIQLCVHADIDVLVLHHQRKGQGGTKPTSLEDVYGSTWITAGAGSVILLWGEAGSELVELTHLKQPADPIGPWMLEHDHHAGTTIIARGFDALAFLRNRGPLGATVADAAQAEHGAPQTTGGAKWKKTERRLRSLVRSELARTDGRKNTAGGFEASRYYATDPLDTPLGHGV